jgi:hypothetical protein
MAENLVEGLLAIPALMNEVAARGGIVSVLDRARTPKPVRYQLVSALQRVRELAVQFIVEIGDDRRAKGESLELCELPVPQDRAMLRPLPGKRDDGKLWFEE